MLPENEEEDEEKKDNLMVDGDEDTTFVRPTYPMCH
jgi:hypothetical protein